MTYVKLGEFGVSSGSVVVSDPCYRRYFDDEKQEQQKQKAFLFTLNGKITNVKNGNWISIVESEDTKLGRRNAKLIVLHKDLIDFVSKNQDDWNELPFCVE